jgi:hypothetical protein
MRRAADARRITAFLDGLGRAAHEEATCYLVGGATAVVSGWRESTIDVDIHLEPARDELLRAIQELKERLEVNVELASPADFIPELPGWRDRSPFVARHGQLTVRHYDLYAQALAKIERWHPLDQIDVAEMLRRGLIEGERLRALYNRIEPLLYRYPAVDPEAFRRRLDAALGHGAGGHGSD